MAFLDLRTIKKFYNRESGSLSIYLDATSVQEPDAMLALDEWRIRSHEVSEDLAVQAGNNTVAEQWLRTPDGPSAVLYGMKNLDQAVEWIDRAFDEHGLEEAIVRGGPQAVQPRDQSVATTLAAHLVITTSQSRSERVWLQRIDRKWSADPRVTLELARELVNWCHLSGGRDYILRGGRWRVEIDWEDAELGIADAIEHKQVIVSSHKPDPIRQRMACFSPRGFVGIQDLDPRNAWEQQLKDLVGHLGRWAPHCDYAFIAPQHGGWPSIHHVAPNYMSVVTIPSVRHLLAEYVPAPFGLQVLTGSHLEKARNLDSWSSERIGRDRFLVASKDLKPWYGAYPLDDRGIPSIASDEVAAAAREDFGDMLLTPEKVAQLGTHS